VEDLYSIVAPKVGIPTFHASALREHLQTLHGQGIISIQSSVKEEKKKKKRKSMLEHSVSHGMDAIQMQISEEDLDDFTNTSSSSIFQRIRKDVATFLSKRML
jgi:hypothetical protein